jgi:hypothetical protein
MGGRARFFLPTTRKRGKKWIIALSCENETKKSKFATRQICFWFLSYFLYTCFSTVVISQEINFITDKKYLPVFVFLFFLFEGLTLLLTFALTVFPYSYLTKNNLCILTLSHFLLLPIKDIAFHHTTMCSTFYHGANPSRAHTDNALFYYKTYAETLQHNISHSSSICLQHSILNAPFSNQIS